MSVILLSIRKQFCDLIFTGLKKYEFRKKAPVSNVDKILVYESRGCGKIVGEILIEDILFGSVNQIWEWTNKDAGIDAESFSKYFEGHSRAIAYKISDFAKYENPIALSSFGISSAPQNYMWIER